MAGPYFDGGVAGESAENVRNEGVGCVFELENAAQLAALLLCLQENPATLAAYRQRCRDGAGRCDRTALALRMLDVVRTTV